MCEMKKLCLVLMLIIGFMIPRSAFAQTSTQILAAPTTTIYQMEEWAIAEEAEPIFVDLAPTFYKIAVEYGIDPAVIYTQSAKETNFMRFTGVLDATFYNPCGLKNTAGGANEDPNAHKRFHSWEEGITAMAHHLALYAGHTDFPMKDTPDPRHFPSIRAKAPTVELLGGKWAPSPDYGHDIVRRMKHLYTMPTEHVFRLSGNDRYETSAVVANYLNRLTRTVLIANGDKPSDALVAAALARYVDGPILLTRTNKLPESVIKEIKKTEASQVIILGGTGSVSDSVEKELKEQGIKKIERIAGNNRYQTSVLIQQYLEEKSKKKPEAAILASGTGFTDALAISSYAGKKALPIYLTDGKTLTLEIKNALQSVEAVTLVGGENTISSTIESELGQLGFTTARVSGANRYETALRIAEAYFPESENFVLANGSAFADALVGAPVAAKYDAPILLTPSHQLPEDVKSHLAKQGKERIALLGGNVSLSQAVFEELKDMMK